MSTRDLFIPITVFGEDDTETELRLPARYDVCPRCNGRGVHDHPAFANGITSDEWRSPDWDDEDRESYMRGDYDVPCTTCEGQRVILVADEEAFTDEQRAAWAVHCETARTMAEEFASERFLREMGG